MTAFSRGRNIFLAIVSSAGALFALPARAATIRLNLPIGSVTEVTGIGQYISEFYKYFVAGIGLVAVAMIMFGGFRWMTAAGSGDKIKQAKDNIVSAVLGVFLALISYLLLYLINPSLVNLQLSLPGITITPGITYTGSVRQASYCSSSITKITTKPTKIINFDAATMEGDASLLNTYIVQAASGLIHPELLKAIQMQETNDGDTMADSSGTAACLNPSPGGVCACGIMQFKPDTAMAYNDICHLGFVAKPTSGGDAEIQWQKESCAKLKLNPIGSICAGAYHLSDLAQEFNDPTLIAAAYNAGAGANDASACCEGKRKWECEWNCAGGEWKPNTGYTQTRNYVNGIAKNMQQVCKDAGAD